MARFTEETLNRWVKPASTTEESRVANAISMVKDAINNNDILKNKSIEIFAQGSYANNTNVRVNSDIDINIRFTGGYYYDLPKDKEKKDFGLTNPINYSFEEFKNDVEQALLQKFGYSRVERRDKCINIESNSYMVETDVVPTWDYKDFTRGKNPDIGSYILSDRNVEIMNYPKQHIKNGKEKNKKTSRKYKRLTRLFKKLRYKMIDDGKDVSENITSFLLECLVWNIPNKIINENDTWNELLRESIIFIYNKTKSKEKCENWGEVSELFYLFYNDRKWTYHDVNTYITQLWNYLEYK